MRSWTLLHLVGSWLTCNDQVERADLIFVLAGRQSRKAYALQLFHQRWAPRLLLSTGRYEIRRFGELNLPVRIDLREIAAGVPAPERHFFVSIEAEQLEVQRIPVRRFGTLSEIEALATWLRDRPHIESVLIVSNSVHLQRVRMCCQALLPERIRLRLVADRPAKSPGSEREGLRADRELVLRELAKVFLYRIVLALRGFGIRDAK